MKKTVLDNFVILYSENNSKDFINYLNNLENQTSVDYLWGFSSLNNLSDTDHINNQKVLKLLTADNLYYFVNNSISIKEEVLIKKNNLKYELNNYSFTFLLDYINEYELSIKKIKNWTIYEQINETSFHYDQNRDGLKHSYTVLIALNDGYTGGEINFENRIGNENIKMARGDVLIYPSNNKYLHKELEVTSGNKYVAIAHF
jgi:hypothetical protein